MIDEVENQYKLLKSKGFVCNLEDEIRVRIKKALIDKANVHDYDTLFQGKGKTKYVVIKLKDFKKILTRKTK
jgi:hypothetical protein